MSDYYLLITDAGKALEAEAHASGSTVNLTDFAVGDGGGSAVTPDAAQTALVNEVYRDAISSLTVDASDDSVLDAECVIPASSGGYTIREIGIFADDGTLYATGSFAEQDKPAPDSGYAASLQIFAELAVSDTSDIALTVQDGSYLTEPQGDTLYLRQDKNLSEIAEQGEEAQAEARDNLALGELATKDSLSASDVSALPITGGTLTGDLVIKDGAPIIQLVESDTGKNYLIIADGSNFRINEDTPGGVQLIYYTADSKELRTDGQFVPNDYSNFDTRYPIRDAISYVGLVADNPDAPYMHRISTDLLIYLASQDWAKSIFVSDVALGGISSSMSYAENGNAVVNIPGGCVIVGLTDIGVDTSYLENVDGVTYRTVQKCINGVWYAVGTTA